MTVLEPILEGLARKVCTELRDQELTEILMLSFSENLPEVLVAQCGKACHFEFKKMVLVRVEIHRVHSPRIVLQIVEDIVSSTGDGQDNIITSNVQQAVVHSGVLPCKRIDILILELGVLGQQIVVVNSVMVILVERRRERQIRTEVNNCRFVRFGSDFPCTLFDRIVNLLPVIRW